VNTEILTGSVLNWVDLICIALAGVFLIYGILRGFMLQLLGIFVLIGSIVVAFFLSVPVGKWLLGRWDSLTPENARWIAFAGIWVVALAIGTALAHLVRGSLARLKMLAYDRLLGAVLGLAKAWLLIVLILQLALYFTAPKEGEPKGIPRAIINSQSGNIARWSTEKIFVFLPEEWAEKLRKYDGLSKEEEATTTGRLEIPSGKGDSARGPGSAPSARFRSLRRAGSHGRDAVRFGALPDHFLSTVAGPV
jgi:uncharacterized membrane protein required for colicin V production